MIPIFEYKECKSKIDLLIMEGKYCTELRASLPDTGNRMERAEREQKKQELRQYRLDNKELVKLQRKQAYQKYYQDNKDKLTSKRNEKITCECGCSVARGCITRHRMTKKHLKLINQ
tara:strand:- start:535 stop:885 length:351 start_codon:yes stop_codon:yes gene_type:complete